MPSAPTEVWIFELQPEPSSGRSQPRCQAFAGLMSSVASSTSTNQWLRDGSKKTYPSRDPQAAHGLSPRQPGFLDPPLGSAELMRGIRCSARHGSDQGEQEQAYQRQYVRKMVERPAGNTGQPPAPADIGSFREAR